MAVLAALGDFGKGWGVMVVGGCTDMYTSRGAGNILASKLLGSYEWQSSIGVSHPTTAKGRKAGEDQISAITYRSTGQDKLCFY